MLKDLFEFEKCYYINYFKVVLNTGGRAWGEVMVEGKKAQKSKKRKSIFDKFKTSVQNKFNDMNHTYWKDSIYLRIKQKDKKRSVIKNNINSIICAKVGVTQGVPDEFRPEVWDFLLSNPMKISFPMFSKMLRKSLTTTSCSAIISKDLERTFFYFFNHQQFPHVVKEAQDVLILWEVGPKERTTAPTSSTSRACPTSSSSSCSSCRPSAPSKSSRT